MKSMKLGKLFFTIAMLAIFLTVPLSVVACQEADCSPPEPIWWWPPQSNIYGYNDAPIVAIINGGSLDVWDNAAMFGNTAAGVNITVPAGCGECPGGMNVSGVNVGSVDAIVNIGDATIRGPLTVDNTAIGVNINAGKK